MSKLKLEFYWSEVKGDTIITPSSLASIQEHFANDPLKVLDFLQDALHLCVEEYNAAYDSDINRMIAIVDGKAK